MNSMGLENDSSAPSFEQLQRRLKNKEAIVGIMGLGYVGLPLAIRFLQSGYRVIGFDIDKSKVEMLKQGKSYLLHYSEEVLAPLRKNFKPTFDLVDVKEMDAIILCVPTPLNKYREPDLSFVIDTTNSVVPHLRKGQVISLESTTYPGTTDEELKPRLESTGLIVGQDIFLIFSPEREDPGRKDYGTRTTPKVVGGFSPRCLEVGKALYGGAIDNIVAVSSTKAAEMTKLLENTHRAVNIGLVNELKIVCDKMGIDIFEVVDAAATKPFGFVPYYPGPGIGGHCIPIDPFYLTWKAREFGVHTRFIELAGEINAGMPSYVLKKLSVALNDRKKSLKGAKILILGAAYKKNIEDMRESPSLFVMEKIKKYGGFVDYSDPFVPVLPKVREHKLNFDLKSVAITPASLKTYDAVVVCTDHDEFDYKMILENAALIVDARGRYREAHPNVVRA